MESTKAAVSWDFVKVKNKIAVPWPLKNVIIWNHTPKNAEEEVKLGPLIGRELFEEETP